MRDSHQEQVSKAVGDGGGCAEAWEALNEMREGDIEHTRRSVLGIGGGAIATLVSSLFPSGGPQASIDEVSDELRRRATEIEGVTAKHLAEVEAAGLSKETRDMAIAEVQGNLLGVPLGIFGCPYQCIDTGKFMQLIGTYTGTFGSCGACLATGSVAVPVCAVCYGGIVATFGGMGNGWCSTECLERVK